MKNGFEHIGEKICAFRASKGMTQEELAYFLGISVPTLISYEKGRVVPDAAMVAKLAEFFNVSSDVILNENISLFLENEAISLFCDGVKISDRERNNMMNKYWKKKDRQNVD